MPVPPFLKDGWLPEGHHEANWEEITVSFGGEVGSLRETVLANLLAWRDAARAKGLSGRIILDGSFVSAKPNPGDFDLIFVYDESSEAIANTDEEARQLLGGSACKARFHGDIFPFSVRNVREHPMFCRTDGFDHDKRTLRLKGVLEVDL